MPVVPVRLDAEDVKRLDRLRRRGLYRSRSEAIRRMLREQMTQHAAEDDDVTSLVEQLLKLERGGQRPVELRLRRTAVEVVAEGRT